MSKEHSLLEAILPLPLYDIHSHIEGDAPAAVGLHDILLYHMVTSDLYSAGCPDGGRLRDRRDQREAHLRLGRAMPFVNSIRNTSCFWGVTIILRDLYHWTGPLTPDNWRKLDARIREQSTDSAWYGHVLDLAHAQRITTEWARRGAGALNDVSDYSLEWAFFARTQEAVNDAPLYELERAWNMPKAGAPMDFTQSGPRPKVRRPIVTVDDALEAITHYCACIPADKVVSTAQHFSTDIEYRPVTEREMAQALAHRAQAGTLERDTYASFILDRFAAELEHCKARIALILSMGAEALPYETAARFRQVTTGHLGRLVAAHPSLRFIAMNASRHADQSLSTLSRELPNFTLAGYWWHSFFPDSIRQVMSTRLDMLPVSNQIGFFSDAYCVEWLYAKAVMVKTVMADVLAAKVAQGRFSEEDAVGIAGQILLETPRGVLAGK
jgi:glucuronate isomerase